MIFRNRDSVHPESDERIPIIELAGAWMLLILLGCFARGAACAPRKLPAKFACWAGMRDLIVHLTVITRVLVGCAGAPLVALVRVAASTVRSRDQLADGFASAIRLPGACPPWSVGMSRLAWRTAYSTGSRTTLNRATDGSSGGEPASPG